MSNYSSPFNIKPATQNYWFRSHKYGFGWTPASWQGWLVVAVYFLILMVFFIFYDKQSSSILSFIFNIAPLVVVATLALMFVTYIKGEPPRWKAKLEERF